MNRNKKKASRAGAGPEHVPAPDLDAVVEVYAAQAAAADSLAEVDTTHLDTPTANPNALATLNAERTRTAREKIQLDFERERRTAQNDHDRLVEKIDAERLRATATDQRARRAVAEGLADADEAADQLTDIRRFDKESSPASAASWLAQAAPGWRKEEFVYALLGSALSAAGMAALLVAASDLTWWTAPLVAGALEVLLTVRVIRLIGQRAALAEKHKNTAELGAQGRKALDFLKWQVVGLLTVSVAINVIGLFVGVGALALFGVAGSVGAMVASISAAQLSTAVTEVIKSNVAIWQTERWSSEREELRARAAGAHIPDLEAAPVRHEAGPARTEQTEAQEIERIRRIFAGLAEEQIAALADRGTDALTLMLNNAQQPPASSGTPSPAGGTPTGTPGFQGGSTTGDQGTQLEPTGNCLRVLEAIRDPRNGLGSTVTNTALADQLDLSRTAVRKHRNWLKEHGYLPSDVTPTDQTDQ